MLKQIFRDTLIDYFFFLNCNYKSCILFLISAKKKLKIINRSHFFKLYNDWVKDIILSFDAIRAKNNYTFLLIAIILRIIKMNGTNFRLNVSRPTKEASVIRPWDFWEYSLLALLIFALTGNSLTIIVMTSKKMRSSNTVLFLKLMAVADICVLSFKFLINMQKLYKIPIYELCSLSIVLPDIFALKSYWLIITTTVERSVAVWFPLRVSQIVTRKRCYQIILLLVCFFTLISSTQIFCLKSLPLTPYYCGIRGSFNGTCKYYIKSVYPWIKSALMSWIPSVLGIVLNAIIIKRLTRARKKRQSISNLFDTKLSDTRKYSLKLGSVKASKRLSKRMTIKYSTRTQEKQITIMLCTVSVSFILLTMPCSIYELIRKLNPNLTLFKKRAIHRAVLFLIDCLHASNFIMYCLTGEKFRNELKKLFPFTCLSPPTGNKILD